MPWHANLNLHYKQHGQRSVLRHEHDGPLRILKSLYPEGDAVCHNVIVHPPGGLVGGDVLDIQVKVGAGAHGLISTPGATRFYASDDEFATQRVALTLEPGARLEWLPLESIAYPGCRARNLWSAELEGDAELMAWDVCALGLPAAKQAFTTGHFHQRLEIPGVWLEQANLDAEDQRLMNAPLGLAGHRCLGTMVFSSGVPLARERRESLQNAARDVLQDLSVNVHAGVTSPNPNMVVIRMLAPVVEPLMAGLQRVWACLRETAWNMDSAPPRIWRV
jgi:urease accessory protein